MIQAITIWGASNITKTLRD
uniref:Uncharacterized protein n=1 Tax=Arundo donax TaxID=35708 RepID=A0A0A8ZLL2_ARUDO